MDDGILASIELDDRYYIHIATLSNEIVKECDADHLGYDGYFVFTTSDKPECRGFDVLAKAPSFEAALELAEIMKQTCRIQL